MKKSAIPILLILVYFLSGCSTKSELITPIEVQMNSSVIITRLNLDRSYYKPGEPVEISAKVESNSTDSEKVTADLSIFSLTDKIHDEKQKITVGKGTLTLSFKFQPPAVTPRGYGIELKITGSNGEILAVKSSAFDVLNNWTQNPRYGFLTDFYPGRTDDDATMALLNLYHINGLQFYDWMYRHEQFLTDQDPYYDLWSPKPKSINTVNGLIDAAHKYGMAAMPYTAIYGSSRDYALKHPEMVLYKMDGEMYDFGGDKMMIMDPRPGSPWTTHLMDQFNDILGKTKFDGIHLDQYGDPKVGYDQNGNSYDLAPAIVDFINQTKDLTNHYSPDNAVVFNLVNNWPVEEVAHSNEDFVYIEVWSPNNWFLDLHSLIVNAQNLSHGKPVVLACYIDPGDENNAILNDAVIFASGGGHIELGENNGMLSEAYFPSYHVISEELSQSLQNYYDFSVRYQEVTGPETTDGTKDYQSRIEIPGVSTSLSQMVNEVWPLVRESKDHTAINLVNFLGVDQPEWNKAVTIKPNSLQNFSLTIDAGTRKAAKIWFATPDDPQARQELAFTQDKNKLVTTVPSLEYWSMIVIDWEN